MTRWLRIIALLVAPAVPGLAVAQVPGIAPPPPPTGPMLVVPAAATDLPPPTWVEGGSLLPPGTPVGPPIGDTSWPVPPVRAGSHCHFDDTDGSNGVFHDPNWFQILGGGYKSSSRVGPPIPKFDYLQASLRHGWHLGNPLGFTGHNGGYWEFVTEAIGAGITTDYGNWFAGGTAMLRYNWTEPGSFIVPYTQFGGGGIWTDAHRNPYQSAIGQSFEFLVQAQMGLKIYVTPNLSLDIEGGYQHISNANLATRNAGVNAFGGQVGFTWHFGGGS